MCIIVKRARVLLKTRLMLQHTVSGAWLDVIYVLAIGSVINSLLGTTLLPLIFVLLQEAPVLPIGFELVYFALLAPLFTSALFVIATIHPNKPNRPKHVARTVFPL